jgi:hypothetical protein
MLIVGNGAFFSKCIAASITDVSVRVVSGSGSAQRNRGWKNASYETAIDQFGSNLGIVIISNYNLPALHPPPLLHNHHLLPL